MFSFRLIELKVISDYVNLDPYIRMNSHVSIFVVVLLILKLTITEAARFHQLLLILSVTIYVPINYIEIKWKLTHNISLNKLEFIFKLIDHILDVNNF